MRHDQFEDLVTQTCPSSSSDARTPVIQRADLGFACLAFSSPAHLVSILATVKLYQSGGLGVSLRLLPALSCIFAPFCEISANIHFRMHKQLPSVCGNVAPSCSGATGNSDRKNSVNCCAAANIPNNGKSPQRSSRPRSSLSSKPATVILTPQQAHMATQKGEVLFDAVSKVAKDGGRAMTINSPAAVFDCPEESLFYSQCIEKMVLTTPDYCHDSIIEFGAGDGSPVISALLKSPPTSGRKIHGYEIGANAAALAAEQTQKFGLDEQYQIHNSCFWKGIRDTRASCLIANPPYLPAPDDDILMPELWGGLDGAELTRDLLSLGIERCMLMISAYSNPVLTLQHARDEGYAVVDFLVTPLPFGTYSSEPKVRHWIDRMRGRGEAFFSPRMYFLAGVLFEKQHITDRAAAAANGSIGLHADNGSRVATAARKKDDLFEELLQVLTAL